MGAADAILAGFADVHVPSDRLPDLIAALVDEADVRAIDRFAARPPAGDLAPHRDTIDTLFAADSVRAITSAVEHLPASPWRDSVHRALSKACPLAMAATLRMVRQAREMARLEEALAMEYRYTWRSLEQGEFMEGIRAAVIDKDRAPRWAKPGLGDVTKADVEAMLAGLGDNELTF
jgi:enoyl-CoA hydratase/carnithine racemase